MPKLRRVSWVTWFITGLAIAVAVAVAPSAVLGADRPHAQALEHARWRQAIVHLPVPGAGCFTASYPAVRWRPAQCVAPPDVPFEPAPEMRPGSAEPLVPATGGNGDYVARVFGPISEATGYFTNVSRGITEKGQYGGAGPQTANTFSLQLNTQRFATSACAGSAAPTKCRGWQQFIYSTHGNALYMEYWLVGYGSKCPPKWSSYKGSCWTDSKGANPRGGPLTAADLAKVALYADAHPGGTDQVTLFGPADTDITAMASSDGMLGLAANWNTAEFAVVGDAGGGQANFGRGTTLNAVTTVSSPSPLAPACLKGSFTAETNNLSLVSTPAVAAGVFPYIVSKQTNGRLTPAKCATAPAHQNISSHAQSVIVQQDGQVGVVAEGPNHSLKYYHAKPGSRWTASTLAGPGTTFAAPSIAQANGTSVVAQGPNHSLKWYFANPVPHWKVATIAGRGTTFSDPSVLMVDIGGDIFVAAQGPNNSAIAYAKNGLDPWTTATAAGAGTTVGDPSFGGECCTGWIGLAAQGAHYSLEELDNVAEQHIATIAGADTTVGDPAIAFYDPNGTHEYIDIAAQGPNNSLRYYQWYNGTNRWTASTIAGANTTDGDPSILVRPDGEVDVAVLGPSFSLRYYHSKPGSRWTATSIGGDYTAYSDPSMAVAPDGEIFIVAQGPLFSLRCYHSKPGSGWTTSTIAGDHTTYQYQ